MYGQGICKWRFDNILLPDSNTNEPASNGYFNFTVKQFTGNQVGTQIRNHAYIFFDFNPAIITDTTLNTIYIPVSVEEITGIDNGNITVFPNPSKGNVIFRVKEKRKELFFELFNALGEKIRDEHFSGIEEFEMQRKDLSPGIYFYTVRNEHGMIGSGKLVIQ